MVIFGVKPYVEDKVLRLVVERMVHRGHPSISNLASCLLWHVVTVIHGHPCVTPRHLCNVLLPPVYERLTTLIEVARPGKLSFHRFNPERKDRQKGRCENNGKNHHRPLIDESTHRQESSLSTLPQC